MAPRIDTVTARSRLKPGREPYWAKLSTGRYLGYRRMGASGGTWNARYWDSATSRNRFHSLGDLTGTPPHAQYDAARKLAEAWFTDFDTGGTTSAAATALPLTISDACATYVAEKRASGDESGALDAEGRFARWITGTPLGKTELRKLNRPNMQTFREKLIKAPVCVQGRQRRRAPATINRDMTALRAALNKALDDGGVSSDFAWRRALKALPDAGGRRTLYLDKAQRATLLAHADQVSGVADLILGMMSLPLRPGALAALCVRDYTPALCTLFLPSDKSGGGRSIVLPKKVASRFAELVKGRPGDAPLLAQASGAKWDKEAWGDLVKSAVISAGLPKAATLYTIRHSVITDLVVGGLDLFTVAKIAGTSVAMIEKFYGHLRQEVATEALEKLALT